MSRRNLCLLVVFPCLVLLGCSDDAYKGRFAVSGKVTHGDKPLKTGIVMFEALEGQDTAATAGVTDGQYSIPRENGLKPGKYRVRVTSPDNKTPVNPVNPDEPPGPTGGTNIIAKDLIPADWNIKSKQEATVKGDGPNTFDFDIK